MPGPQGRGAGSLRHSDPALFASYYADAGEDEDTILARVELAFPSLTEGEAASAVQTGIQASKAGENYKKLGRNKGIPDSRIPIDPSQDVAYRYVVVGRIFCPDDGSHHYVTMVIDADHNLTKDELEDAVAEQWNEFDPMSPSGADLENCEPDSITIDTVQAVTRS